LQRARQEWSKAGQHLSPPAGSLELGKQSILTCVFWWSCRESNLTLYQGFYRLNCRFAPSRSDSFLLDTCGSISGLDGVKSGTTRLIIRGTAYVATFSGLAMASNRVILASPISTVRTPSKAISDVNRDGGCAVGAKHGRAPTAGCSSAQIGIITA
jgi:hypothetical protein